jgi:hypothetical protein
MTRSGDVLATDIAWCGQVDRARRERWASKQWLKKEPPFTEHDAVETAIAFSLSRRGISQKAAALAWRAVQRDVQRLLIAGERSLWIVVSAEGPRAWATPDAGAAAQRAEGQGRCWIVNTETAADEARARYAELATKAPQAKGHLASLRQATSNVRRNR